MKERGGERKRKKTGWSCGRRREPLGLGFPCLFLVLSDLGLHTVIRVEFWKFSQTPNFETRYLGSVWGWRGRGSGAGLASAR